MSLQEAADKAPPRKRRFHKRTLAIVFCFVVLPWILVAIPGEQVGGWGTTGSTRQAYEHGWPFIHLDCTEAIVDGNWVNGIYYPGQIPPGLELDELAKESAREHPPLRLDLRFNRQQPAFFGEPPSMGESGFWTDPTHWPCLGKGRYLQVRPLGLICNLLILGLVSLLVGWAVERRLRRKVGFSKFSLKSLLVVMALVAFATGWAVREYSRHLILQENLSVLIENDIFLSAEPNFKGRFPHVVSQLFNHGHLTYLDPSFFVVLNDRNPGRVYVSLELGNNQGNVPFEVMDAEIVNELVEVFESVGFAIDLEVWTYGRQVENELVKFEQANVESLEIAFDLRDWVESFSDEEGYRDNIRKDLKISGERVNITAKFPHLKTLHLHLDYALEQKSQLESFCGLESLEEVHLDGLTQAGVDFLLETKAQWPKRMFLEFEDDVADQSADLLVEYFGLSYEDEDEGVPGSGGVF